MDTTVDLSEIAAFQADGVVVLRDKFSTDWLDVLREEITSARRNPGPNQVRHTADDGPGYYEDFWAWSDSPAFTRFVRESPAAELAAQLLGAPSMARIDGDATSCGSVSATAIRSTRPHR